MKIVIDDKIPFIKGALEPFAEVVYLPGSQISANDVRDADALVVRTRTRCDRKLLGGSKVRFVATATIGFDHIDADFCKEAGIRWTNAPGCNSGSVMQYIASAFATLKLKGILQFNETTLGVVGVGNVGTKIARLGDALGMRVLKNDPPRERREGPGAFAPLEHVLEESDVVTLHVPLIMSGADKTFHLLDRNRLSLLKKKSILINTSRGEAIKTEDLKEALRSGKTAIVDVWENEPDISRELLDLVALATPHIAGYSQDGKANGTEMSVRAIAGFFGFNLGAWRPEGLFKPSSPHIDLSGENDAEAALAKAILAAYRIEEDDARLRAAPAGFEKLRGDYPPRREFPAYEVATADPGVADALKKIGFSAIS